MRFKSLALSLLVFVSSCRTPPLEVDFVYVGARSLASYWVCTPDPQLCDPPTGQKLVLLWQFTQPQWNALVAPKLHLRVRFADRQEKELWWDIAKCKGKVIYANVGSTECPPPAISTYRVEVVTEGKVAYCVEQALWTEWIALQGGGGCDGGGEAGCAEPQETLTAFQSSAETVELNETETKRTKEGGEEETGGEGQIKYVWDDLEEIQ